MLTVIIWSYSRHSANDNDGNENKFKHTVRFIDDDPWEGEGSSFLDRKEFWFGVFRDKTKT